MNARRRILPLAVLALGSAVVAGEVTLASHSDVESTREQLIRAGTLSLRIDGGQFSILALAPGQSGSRMLTVQNLGSLEGGLVLRLDVVADSEIGACTASESADPDEDTGSCSATGELDDVLQVSLAADTDGDGSFDRVILGPDMVKALNGQDASEFLLPAGAQRNLRLGYRFPDDTPHEEAMSDLLAFDITGRLESR